MCCGSIFTSSDSGSCRRRAMDTAPRRETSIPGSSSAASSEALYTLAPASLTTTQPTSSPPACSSLQTRATNCSVSRDAVPLPMATTSTACLRISAARSEWARRRLSSGAGGCGKTAPVSTILPVASTTASLQPVRNAGSTPSTTLPGRGACSRRLDRFLPKTCTALACALVVRSERSSLSIVGLRSRLTPSCAAASTSSQWVLGRGRPRASAAVSASALAAAAQTAATSQSTATLSSPAASPRLIASVWWGCSCTTVPRKPWY
mmetsp:Transcript_46593/g.118904  ORF Transcript_46593/g.118904 Transcript_46593/m.118904 type:complete len:264 (+) Transcript_46593:148-939(+)